MVHFHPHPLGGVAGFALAGGRQDVLSHGGGEVRGRRPSLQEEKVDVEEEEEQEEEKGEGEVGKGEKDKEEGGKEEEEETVEGIRGADGQGVE